MEKKPVNFVIRNAEQAAKELNKIVEEGGSEFDIGINPEYVITVTKNSDGTTKEEKERVYRIIGFVNMMVGPELDSLNAVKEEMKTAKKEREEMNRTLNLMNKSAFAPVSILLLGIAIFTLVFGILTLAGVLPLPDSQIAIAIILVIVGALALGGSIILAIFRNKKKQALLAKKDEILAQDQDLNNREKDLDNRIPKWYKNALWKAEGNTIKNAAQSFVLK